MTLSLRPVTLGGQYCLGYCAGGLARQLISSEAGELAQAALADYAREDDDIYFWRLDRIGRSVIDVLNTVNDFTSRGIRLHSIMDSLDPTSVQGTMQLAIMATLAEYERELINERVRAGVISAQKRGVRFGPAPMEQSIARDRVNTACQLMAEGKTAEHAA